MLKPIRDRHKRNNDLLSLCAFIVLCLTVNAGSGVITATSVDTWYQTLKKSPFNPPDWIFAPIWTSLYILMGIAAWRVWRLRSSKVTLTAFAVFTLQLCLNLAWSFLFFGLQRTDLALVGIAFLLCTIMANAIIFWQIERLAGILFVPYVAWVTFAAILNASLWILNKV